MAKLEQAISLLKDLERLRISGEIYWRSLPVAYQDTPLEWSPSFLDGNRYNPPNKFAALYFAASPRLAEREVEARLKPEYQEARRTLPFRVEVGGVVDLTAERNLERLTELGIGRDDLVRSAGGEQSGYQWTQLIGAAAYQCRISGLMVFSSRPNEPGERRWHNLALFPVHLLAPFISPA